MSKFLKKYNKQIYLLIIILTIGVFTLIFSKAAVSTATLEPENGTLTNNISKVNSSSSSNNANIRFNLSTNTNLHTDYPNAFVKPDGTVVKINGVNIRNVGSYSAATICGGATNWQGIKDHGFNTVRLAVDWPSIEPTQNQIDPNGIAKLDDAVNTAKNAGLYVILDGIHLKSGTTNTPSWTSGDSIDRFNQGASWYWAQLANRYKNDSNVIGYDLTNEPHSNVDDNNRILTMYQNIITTIRPIDSEKIIIIEPNSGDRTWGNVNWGIITNKSNLVVSHHSYFAGGDDDGYSSSGWPAGNQVYDGVQGYTITASSANQIAAHFDKMLNELSVPRLPLYLGEYGINKDGANHEQWVTDNVTALNTRNIPRTYWEGCSGGSFSLHIASNNTWVPFTNLFTW